MTHAEISEALGIPRQTVQYIEKQAMKNFKRKWVAKYGWPEFGQLDDSELFVVIMTRLRELKSKSFIIEDPFEEEVIS